MADEKKATTTELENQAKNKSEKKEKGCFETAVLVALIGIIPAILVAVLGFPPFAAWINGFLTPTATLAPPIPMATSTLVPDLRTLIPPSLRPPLSSATLEASLVPPNSVVQVNANLDVQPRYEGKAPFRVTFNLENSKFQLANGDIVYCRNVGTCQFSLSIFRNGVVLEDFQNTKGIQVYTFIAPGIYNVTAGVCQGDVCDKTDAEIVVK